MHNPESASTLREKGWILVMGLAAFLMLYPLLFMLTTSFKDMNQIFHSSLNPFSWPPTMANYEVVLEKFPFYQYLGNTLYISVVVTLGKLATSLLAAFAFVYYEFKGKEKLFSAMLLTFFIPTTVLVMPNYLLQWIAIQDAMTLGCRVYDFRGISGSTEDPADPLAGLWRFKSGFGAERVRLCGEFIDPLMPRVNRAMERLLPLGRRAVMTLSERVGRK